MKIYNEVVIDMNPESSTFEQTLYEDSYEYSGDMMLAKKQWRNIEKLGYGVDGGVYWIQYKISNNQTHEARLYYSPPGGSRQPYFANEKHSGGTKSDYKSFIKAGVRGKNQGKDYTSTYTTEMAIEDAEELGDDSSLKDYGAPNLTRDDFFESTGERKDINEISELIEKQFPGQDPTALRLKIEQQIPDLKEMDKTELGFLSEQYGGTTTHAGEDNILGTDDDEEIGGTFGESLAGEAAGQEMEADMFGLQKGAKKLGKQAQGIYSGMASAGRGQTEGLETLSKGFEATQDKYGLAKKEADFKYREGVYGLEKKRFDEQEFSSWLTENFADAGGT